MSINSFGGRKFIFVIIVSVMGFVLVLTNKVVADSFLEFIKVMGGVYVVGNVGATVANRLPDGK